MPEEVIEFTLAVERDKIQEFAMAVGEDNKVYYDPQLAHLEGFPELPAPPTFTVTQIFEVPRDEREQRLGANLNYARVSTASRSSSTTVCRLPARSSPGRCGSRRTSSKRGSAADRCAS